MLSLSDALLGLGLPALCSAVLFFVSRRTGGDAVFVVGAGFLAGYVAINQRSWIPLSEPAHCVFLGAAATLLVVAVHRFLWASAWFWHITSLLILAAAIAGAFVLLADPEWTVAQKILLGITFWIASALMTIGLEFRFRRAATGAAIEEFFVAAALAIVSGLAAAVNGMSGTQTYGQIAAIVPAALAPVVLLSALLRTRIISPSFAPLYVLLADGMILCTYLFAELSPLSAILLSISPLGLLFGLLPIVRTRAVWHRSAIQLFAVLLPAAIAFGLTLSKFLREMSAEFGMY